MQQIRRRIRSFVKREGRMTLGQTQAFESMMPIYGLDYQPEILDLDSLFGNQAPITLEIGFGMGGSLVEQAANNPDKNYLGIEVHRPGVGALLLKMQHHGVTNIRVVSHDAIDVLNHMIPDYSIKLVQLFFPDPWHKRKHHKRRIVSSEFLHLLHKKVEPSGHIHFATDWQDYAVHMLRVLKSEHGWRNCATDDGYFPRPETRPLTKFEKRGERLGHGVWDLMFQREP